MATIERPASCRQPVTAVSYRAGKVVQPFPAPADPQVAARRRSLVAFMDEAAHHGGGSDEEPADGPHPWS